MAPLTNGTVVSEDKYDGIHTIIIHVQLPQTVGFPLPEASANGSDGVETEFEESDLRRKEAVIYEESVSQQKGLETYEDSVPQQEAPVNEAEKSISHREKPIIHYGEPVTNGHPQKAPYIPDDQAPPSRFELRCHPRADQVCAELDEFFSTYWPWENEQARQNFIAADTNRWACWSLPLVRDDRVVNSVKVNTLLFLLDDAAENMSLEDGQAFYHRLIEVAKGNIPPNREDPYEWITYDTFASMRADDERLTAAVLEDAILCVTAQVDDARNHCVGMGALLKQRYKEGGVRFVAAVARYGMDLKVTDTALEQIKDIEISYSRLGIIVNDIYSLSKELRAFKKGKKEGARVLNMVQMQALETGVSYDSAKRVLWLLCREWEIQHLDLVAAKEKQLDKDGLVMQGERDEDLRLYLKALEHVLSGNEKWSEYTQRYHEKDVFESEKLNFNP